MALRSMTQSSSVLRINGFNFDEEVLRSKLPVLVDCSAEWCQPCKLARPVLERMATELSNELKVVEIDGAESPELLSQLHVRGFPTFVLFRGGEETRRLAGFAGPGKLMKFAQDALDGQDS